MNLVKFYWDKKKDCNEQTSFSQDDKLFLWKYKMTGMLHFTFKIIISMLLRPKKNALFMLDLTMEKTGVQYNTDLESFGRVVIALFDKGITCTKNVPQLEKMVIEGLFWSGTPLLESVGENEPEVVRLRETVRHAIKQSLIPLRAYARQYEKYLELFNLDINQYLA